MKIAYLANVRIPSERAHSTQIVHMCQAFSQLGNEVHLVANKRTSETLSELASYYKLQPLFKIIRLHHGFFVPGIKITYFFSEFFFAFNFLLSKKIKYDLIYSRNEWVVLFLSVFLSNKLLVWESHEAKLNLPARIILSKGIKTAVISEGIEEVYLKQGIDKSQLLVAHDGIDESFFGQLKSKQDSRNRLGIEQNKKVAMYIGGFDTWKGIETFLAGSELCPDVHFVAIGGSAKEIAIYKSKFPRVQFIGPRPYAELKDNQQAADILVIPNSGIGDLSAKFTSPLKLFSYLASGIPVIASDIPSITNITGREEVTLVKPDSSPALARGIEDVLVNYETKKISAQKLQTYSRKYTWLERARLIMDFLGINKEVL